MVESKPTTEQSTTERARGLVTVKNLHIFGVAILGLVCVYLLAHIAYAWQAAKSQDASAIAQQEGVMRTAEASAKPLAGVDEKLKQATADADKFYATRLPYSYSGIAGELGVLKNKAGVKLTRVQYAESPVLEGGVGPLTEVRMDASLNGDYRPLVTFINGLERDKMFFLIRGVSLVGQQGGTVGVRLALTTYLRPATGDERTDESKPPEGALSVDQSAAPTSPARKAAR